MKRLTKVEEQVMQIIWISSVVRILESKGFVGHKAYGRTYEYFPLISKEDYSRQALKGLVGGYFGGSVNSLVSFLVKENDMDIKDLNGILQQLNDTENNTDDDA